MTAAMITDNPVVRALYELPAPVVTAYLRAPDVGAPDDRELRLRAMLDRLHPRDATPESLRALASVLGAVTENRPVDTGRPTAAAFVGADGQTRLFELPEAHVEDQLHVSAVPHVLPMLEWRQGRPAYVLVLLDRTGAELVVQPAGAAPAARTEVEGPDDEIERNAPGGWSQPRYQNRAEDSWQHNAGRAAEATLQRLGYKNVHVKIGDGYKGWPEAAPFDAIIVTCASDKVPQPLTDQLKDGGRMVIPVGERFAQQLFLLEKKNGQLRESVTLPVRFVPMLREAEKQK